MNPGGIIAHLKSAEATINITKNRSLAIILRDVRKTEETPAALASYLISRFLAGEDHITQRLNCPKTERPLWLASRLWALVGVLCFQMPKRVAYHVTNSSAARDQLVT